MAVPGQGGVGVDGVGHHGGPEHARGQQHRRGALEPRHDPGDGLTPGHGAEKQAGDETRGDDRQQSGHDELEEPGAAVGLEDQQQHRDHPDDHAPGQQRDPEENVQGDRPTYHLGQIRGRGHQLGLDPVPQSPAPGQTVTQQLGQTRSGDQPDLGRKVLDEDRHGIGGHQHPHQQISVLGAGSEIRRDVARIHVGHGGHKSRAQ